MNILFATPYKCTTGGIAQWAGHIVSYYERLSGVKCALDVLPMNDPKSGRSTVGMSLCHRIIYGIQTYSRVLKSLRKRLSADKYDILHISTSASISLSKDYLMIKCAKRRCVRAIVHFHFGRIPQIAKSNNWEWKLLKRVVRLADCAVVMDKASYDTLIANGFDNISLLPNPVAPRVVEIAAENANIQREPRSLLFVGHVVKTKGVFELLEACSKIENINLQVVGHITPEMQAQIETLYKDASWLAICGEKPYDDVVKEMCKCDVFVLPTYTEGFPNVILESMACGCAIVTTPVGAIPEMLEEESNNHYGVMVEPRNVEQLKAGIEKMLSDADFKSECRANVQQRVIERYNMDSVWRQMTGIWDTVLSNKNSEKRLKQ